MVNGVDAVAAILTKWDGDKKAAADKRYLETISADSFNAAVKKRLRDQGIAVDDANARRTVSTQLADELFMHRVIS